jgi:hypothetical protein
MSDAATVKATTDHPTLSLPTPTKNIRKTTSKCNNDNRKRNDRRRCHLRQIRSRKLKSTLWLTRTDITHFQDAPLAAVFCPGPAIAPSRFWIRISRLERRRGAHRKWRHWCHDKWTGATVVFCPHQSDLPVSIFIFPPKRGKPNGSKQVRIFSPKQNKSEFLGSRNLFGVFCRFAKDSDANSWLVDYFLSARVLSSSSFAAVPFKCQ